MARGKIPLDRAQRAAAIQALVRNAPREIASCMQPALSSDKGKQIQAGIDAVDTMAESGGMVPFMDWRAGVNDAPDGVAVPPDDVPFVLSGLRQPGQKKRQANVPAPGKKT